MFFDYLLENDVIFPQNLTFFFINKNIKANKAKIIKKALMMQNQN